jgi:hypothetical protein
MWIEVDTHVSKQGLKEQRVKNHSRNTNLQYFTIDKMLGKSNRATEQISK